MGYQLISKATANQTLSKDIQVIQDVIKQSYINRTKHGYDPQWETIKARVNKAYFESVDINDKDLFRATYTSSVHTLDLLNRWYYKHFLADKRSGIVSVPLRVQIDKSLVIATADIVLIDEKNGPVPLIFGSNDMPANMLYNSIKFKGLLWLIKQETGMYPKVAEYITINESIQVSKVFSTERSIDNTKMFVSSIVKNIQQQIFYPSVNEQCHICPFKDICSI